MAARTAIATGLATFCVASTVQAQSVCVECKGPDQTYRCSIKDGEKVKTVRGVSRAIEYVCMTELARAGQHQSCRVGSGYNGPCIGQDYQIDIAKLGTAAPTATEQPVPTDPPPENPGVQATPAKDGPPNTLEELARNTMSKSKEQISNADQTVKKAGDAVGGTLKKTWDCVATFFSRC